MPETPSRPSGWRAYVQALGPGLITGASDDDPSGIATYSQAGAQFGFGMLWVALLTFPLMAGVQEICDRTALASGKTLGALIAVRFNRAWQLAIGALIAVLVVANALNIAADLLAVGQGMQLLDAGPSAWWALGAGGSSRHCWLADRFRSLRACLRFSAARSWLTWVCSS